MPNGFEKSITPVWLRSFLRILSSIKLVLIFVAVAAE